jgi:hypothetical protein
VAKESSAETRVRQLAFLLPQTQDAVHIRPRCDYEHHAVSACFIPIVTAAWWPFPPKRFTGNGLLSAGPLGLDNDERVIAFGDFNNDQ